MNRFVPCSSLAVAETISAHLWSLSRPPDVREPDEATAYLFDWRQDAAGTWWLAVITDYVIPVHVEAVLDGIADILQAAGISQQEIDTLAAVVIANRGGIMTPWDYFPQAFKDASRTEEQITWPTRA